MVYLFRGQHHNHPIATPVIVGSCDGCIAQLKEYLADPVIAQQMLERLSAVDKTRIDPAGAPS